MAKLPIDPKLSRILIEADKKGCLKEACVITTALAIADPRQRPAEKAQAADQKHTLFKDPASDFITLLNIWNAYKKAEKKLKTNKENIKEKDPILFGVQSYMPDKLYYIIDWIDEHCDLTLDKFIDDIKKSDPDYDVDRLDDINPRLIKKLVTESREKHKRLKDTNMGNYKSLMKEEDEKLKWGNAVEKVQGFFGDTKKNILKKMRKK